VRTKNEIVAELFNSREFNDCINKMDPEHLRDDLRSEVALILLETEDQKIMAIDQKGELRFYTVRIILNLIQSKTSPFYKKYRMISSSFIPEKGIEDGLNGRYHKELMEEKAMSYISKLYWYDKEIVQLYLKLGSYRAIEKDTGIPWESCYSTIRKVIKQIRNELKPV
jgi:hypothetical protein